LIKEFQKNNSLRTTICVTGQHRQMLDQILEFFNISPDYDLDLMKPDQNLNTLTSDLLLNLKPVILKEAPDLIFVQGDTTTAFAGSLSAFYQRIKVAHLEAGLRSFDKYAPFPEEINRKIVGILADFHFTPTELGRQNLKREGITKHVYVVGNTVVDALNLGFKMIDEEMEQKISKTLHFVDFKKEVVLITSHRRENFGDPVLRICRAIKDLASIYKNIQFVFPVHLNPKIRKDVFSFLSGSNNIYLIDPLAYPAFIFLMKKSLIILTDSGGIQEEAASVGKPVLVMRDVTERNEGIEAGGAILVGTSAEKIVAEFKKLLNDTILFNSMILKENPYGDGKASGRIVQILLNNL